MPYLADGRDLSAVLLSSYSLPASSPFESVGHAMLEQVRLGCLAVAAADQGRVAALIGRTAARGGVSVGWGAAQG